MNVICKRRWNFDESDPEKYIYDMLFCLWRIFPPKMCENKKKSVFGRESPPKIEMPFMLYRFCGINLFDKNDKFVIYLLSFLTYLG